MTDYLNRTRKYVVSGTVGEPAWDNSTVLRGDPVAEITVLKEQDAKFADATGRPGRRLAEVQPFRSGIVLSRYRRDRS